MSAALPVLVAGAVTRLKQRAPRATVLALGGASWPQLGSDGAWAPWLTERGVEVAPLQPANCGFDVGPTAAHPGAPARNTPGAGA